MPQKSYIAKKKEMIERSFKKCGISIAADGSEEFEIHLEGLEDYRVCVSADDSSDMEADPFDHLSNDDEMI